MWSEWEIFLLRIFATNIGAGVIDLPFTPALFGHEYLVENIYIRFDLGGVHLLEIGVGNEDNPIIIESQGLIVTSIEIHTDLDLYITDVYPLVITCLSAVPPNNYYGFVTGHQRHRIN